MSTLRLLTPELYYRWFNLAVEECIFRQMPAHAARSVSSCAMPTR